VRLSIPLRCLMVTGASAYACDFARSQNTSAVVAHVLARAHLAAIPLAWGISGLRQMDYGV